MTERILAKCWKCRESFETIPAKEYYCANCKPKKKADDRRTFYLRNVKKYTLSRGYGSGDSDGG